MFSFLRRRQKSRCSRKSFFSGKCACKKLAARNLAIEPLEQRQLLSLTALANEQLANSYVFLEQQTSTRGESLAAKPDGGWAVAYSSQGQDGSGKGVYARHFAGDGTPLAAEFQVNTYTACDQEEPSVSIGPDGSSVIVWESTGQDNSLKGIFGQRFDVTGVKIGPEFQINTTAQGNQRLPSVTHLADGRFVVVWNGKGTGDEAGSFGRCYAADGTPLGPEFLVNTDTQHIQYATTVAATAEGGFVVAWMEGGGGDLTDIYAQRFDADGVKTGSAFQVNTTTQRRQEAPAIAASPQGGFVIAWQGRYQDGDGWGVYAQRFDAAGEMLGDEMLVNTTVADNQIGPAVAYDCQGSFVITWSGKGAGDNSGVFARQYAADGTPAGSEFLVNNTTILTQELPAVAAAGSGYVIAWGGKGSGDNNGVFLRQYGWAPDCLGFQEIIVEEDAANTWIETSNAFHDVNDPPELIRYELVGNSNPALFSSARILDNSWELVLDYAPNVWGSATLTVRATDPSGLYVDAPVNVTVTPVNDAPVAEPSVTILVRQNASPMTFDLYSQFVDLDNPLGSLLYQVVQNSNPALLAANLQGHELAVTYQPGVSGSSTVVVRATDPGGLSADFSLNLAASTTNLAPQVLGMIDEPDPTIEGAPLHLQVRDVVDDIQVASISFWRDADHNGSLDPAVDQLLGTDNSSVGGWEITISTAGFGTGGQTYFAQATDIEQLSGNVASITGNVGGEAILDNSMPTFYCETGVGWTDVNDGFMGNARRHAAGIGQNSAQWSFDGLVVKPHTVYVTWMPDPTLASDAVFSVYDGQQLLTTVPVDQRQAPSDAFASEAWWLDLGTFTIQHGGITVVLSDAANGPVVADAVRLVDPPPTIGSVDVTAEVTRPENITLTANDVEDSDGTVTQVAFYRDSNGNAQFDSDDDQFLGKDISSAGGWSIMVSSLTIPSGSQTYFAQATDDSLITSDVLNDKSWATNVVNGPCIAGSVTTNEGAAYTLYLDPNGIDVEEWTIDWGDGSDDTVLSSWDPSNRNITHVYSDGPADWTISTTADDGVEEHQANTLAVHVENFAPYLAIGGDATVDEGDDYTLNLSSSDPGDDTILRWQITWGDGNVQTVEDNPIPSTVTHTYSDGGAEHTITATATDEDGTYGTGGSTAGVLDPTFGQGGIVRTDPTLGVSQGGSTQHGRYMVIQSDGKTIVVGYGGNYRYLARYNTDGTLDSTFGVEGRVATPVNTTTYYATSAALQTNGKIIVAGYRSNGSNNDFSLARYDVYGNLDRTFGVDGEVVTNFSTGSNDLANGVTVDSDGKIIVVGVTGSSFALARYQANGALDIDFGTSGKKTISAIGTNYLSAVTTDANHKIIAAGTGRVGMSTDFIVFRFQSNGNLDTTFGQGGARTVDFSGYDTCYSVALDADGKILVAGQSGNGDFALARLTSSGMPDNSFGSLGKATADFGSTDTGYSVAINQAGIYVAGTTSSGNNFALACFTSGGILDTNFGTGGKTTADFGMYLDIGYSATIDTNGCIYVAGYTTSSGSGFALARFTSGGNLDSYFDEDGKVVINFAYSDYGQSVTIDASGRVYVAGYANNDFMLTRYTSDGNLDATFGTGGKAIADFGGNDSGYSVAIDTSGCIYVAGYTTNGNNFALARFTSGGILDTTFGGGDGMATANFGGTDYGYSVAFDDTNQRIYVAGSTTYGSDLALACFTSSGSLDSTFNEDGLATVNFNGADYGRSVVVDSTGIYVAGYTSNGNNIVVVRFTSSGSLDSSFGTGGKATAAFNYTEYGYSMTVDSTGIYVAGYTTNGNNFALTRFTSIGDVDASFGTGGMATANFGGNDYGYSAAIDDEGRILVAGYSSSGYDLALARFDEDGALDATFGTAGMIKTNLGGSDYAYALALQPDGLILLAGYSQADFAVARYYPGVIKQRVAVECVPPTIKVPADTMSVSESREFAASGYVVDGGLTWNQVYVTYGDGSYEYPTITGNTFELSNTYSSDDDYMVTMVLYYNGSPVLYNGNPVSNSFDVVVNTDEPTVVLESTEPDTFKPLSSYASGEPGVFRVSLVGETPYSMDVQVFYTISGSAEFGIDYEAIPDTYFDSAAGVYRGTVTIDQGSLYADIDVSPLFDGLTYTDPADITVTLDSYSGGLYPRYALGETTEDSVTINDSDVNGLVMQSHFIRGDLNPSSDCPWIIDVKGPQSAFLHFSLVYDANENNQFDLGYDIVVAEGLPLNVFPEDYDPATGATLICEFSTYQMPAGGDMHFIVADLTSTENVTVIDSAMVHFGGDCPFVISNTSSGCDEDFSYSLDMSDPDVNNSIIWQEGEITLYDNPLLFYLHTHAFGEGEQEEEYWDWVDYRLNPPYENDIGEILLSDLMSRRQDLAGFNVTSTLTSAEIQVLTQNGGYSIPYQVNDMWDDDCSCGCNLEPPWNPSTGMDPVLIQQTPVIPIYVPRQNPGWISPRLFRAWYNLLNFNEKYVYAWTHTAAGRGPTLFFEGDGGLSPVQVGAPLITDGLPPGHYVGTMVMIGVSGSQSDALGMQVCHEAFDIAPTQESAFGSNWWYEDLDQLIRTNDGYNENGLLLYTGDGKTIWFSGEDRLGYEAPLGTNRYLKLIGDDELHTKTVDDFYLLDNANGIMSIFDQSGNLLRREDVEGNILRIYEYTDGNLSEVSDASGRTLVEFAYTNKSFESGSVHKVLLDTVTDEQGLTFTVTHDYRLIDDVPYFYITQITAPDPDGVGTQEAPEWILDYDYDAETNPLQMLSSVTNPVGAAIQYSYDSAGNLIQETYPNGASQQLASKLSKYLGSLDPENPLEMSESSDPCATKTDQLGNVTTYTWGTDETYGDYEQTLNPTGEVTREFRDNGRLVRKTVDPDGDGPLGEQATAYVYDLSGHVAQITYSDDTYETWQYEQIGNVYTDRLTSYTNALGITTNYGYTEIDDNDSHYLEKTAHVVGNPNINLDTEYLSIHDDDSAVYYLDSLDQWHDYSKLPADTLLRTIDPQGRITEYIYETSPTASFGKLLNIVYAPGTTDEGIVQYIYDESGNKSAEVDELGRRTDYVYDNLNRLINTVGPYRVDGSNAEILLDQIIDEPSRTGTWDQLGTGYEGDSWGIASSNPYTYEATWSFGTVTSGKTYEILLTWAPDAQNTSVATYVITGGTLVGTQNSVNQQLSPEHTVLGSRWQRLGTWTATGGTITVTLQNSGDGRVVADAVRLVEAPETGPMEYKLEYDYEYNGIDNRTAEIDAMGNRTDMVYCPLGVKMTKSTGPDPDGDGPQTRPVTVYGLNKAINIAYTVDPMGRLSTSEYDALNRPVKDYRGELLDNASSGDNWTVVAGGYNGSYLVSSTEQQATTSWTFDDLVPGRTYEVAVSWVANGANSTDADYTVTGGTLQGSLETIDQTQTPYHSLLAAGWHKLGNYLVSTGSTLTVTLSNGGDSRVVADAVAVYDVSPVSQTAYDGYGNVATTTDALGNVTYHAYDVLNRPRLDFEKTATIPEGDATHYTQTGTWTPGGSGDTYRVADAVYGSTPDATAQWTFEDLEEGETYEVLVTWQLIYNQYGGVENAWEVPYNVFFDSTVGAPLLAAQVCQAYAPDYEGTSYVVDGRAYRSLGRATLADDGSLIVRLANNSVYSGKVVADNVCLINVTTASRTVYDAAGQATAAIDPLGRVSATQYDDLGRTTATFQGLVIDDGDDGFATDSAEVPAGGQGFNGDSIVVDSGYQASWTFEGLTPNADGQYDLYAYQPDGYFYPNNFTAVDGDEQSLTIDYYYGSSEPLLGDGWHKIGTIGVTSAYTGSEITVILTGGYDLTADAVCLLQRTSATAYDPAGNVASTADALGNSAFYDYDARGRQTAVVRRQDLIDDVELGTRYNETTGDWSDTGYGYGNSDARYAITVDSAATTAAQWTFTVPQGGVYEVLAAWPTYYNVAQDAPFSVYKGAVVGSPALSVLVDQSVAPDATGSTFRMINGVPFRVLGTVQTGDPTLIVQLANNSQVAGYYVLADAICLLQVQSQTVYDAAGQVTSVTDALGGVTAYQYDPLGRQIKTTLPDPDGAGPAGHPVYQTVYDADGNVLQSVDPLGNVTTSEYDHLNRLIRQTAPDADGNPATTGDQPVTEYVYNANGSLAQLIAPGETNGERVTTYQYDYLGRQVKVTQPDPDGPGGDPAPWTVYAYDARGNVLSETDRLDHSTIYEYDKYGRLVLTTDALDGETEYQYYADGTLKSLTDSVGNATSYEYDYFGRKIAETNELDLTRYFRYDVLGRLTRQIDRRGWVRDFTYDALSRNTREYWYYSEAAADADTGRTNAENTFTFTYDAAGRVLSVADFSAAYEYEYDALGRVLTIAQTLAGLTPTIVMSQTYDAVGNRTQLSSSVGASDDFVDDYLYDALGRMTQVSQYGVTPYTVAEKQVDFSYNLAGQFSAIDRYADLAGTDEVATGTYGYDLTGRLTDLTYTKSGATLPAYTWDWDAANRITQFTSSLDAAIGYSYGTATYTYDYTNQLTDAEYSNWLNPPDDEDYDYDANGNRDDNVNWDVGQDNQMIVGAGYKYLYDAEGNRQFRFVSADAELNSGDTDITKYIWDNRNRLTGVVHYADFDAFYAETSDWSVANQYDYLNRWIHKDFDPDGSSGSADHEQTVFAYDVPESPLSPWERAGVRAGHIALQFDKTGSGSAGASDLSHRYLYGPAVDQILADETADDGGAEDVLWTLTDHLNTVRDLAVYHPVTDQTTIDEHRVYDAFGNRTSPATVDCLFGFTGKPFDEDTGLQYNINRWYEPSTGKWISVDPIAADLSLYRYCHNSLTNVTDPLGLDEFWRIHINNIPVHYLVAKGYKPFYITDPKYPGPWGQLASATSGSINKSNGAKSTVNLEGGNVCNTILKGDTYSFTNDAGAIRVQVLLPAGCYEILWQWEVRSSGNANAGVASVTALSGTVSGKTTVLNSAVLTPGFGNGGNEKTIIDVSSSDLDPNQHTKRVGIALYDPTLSRTSGTGSGGSKAHSSTTGRITILQIKRVK